MPKSSDESHLTFLSISSRTPSSSMTEPRLSESKSNFWSTGNSIQRPKGAVAGHLYIRGNHAYRRETRNHQASERKGSRNGPAVQEAGVQNERDHRRHRREELGAYCRNEQTEIFPQSVTQPARRQPQEKESTHESSSNARLR